TSCAASRKEEGPGRLISVHLIVSTRMTYQDATARTTMKNAKTYDPNEGPPMSEPKSPRLRRTARDWMNIVTTMTSAAPIAFAPNAISRAWSKGNQHRWVLGVTW